MLQPNHSQSREIVTDIFKQITKKYNFRHIQDFKITSMNTKYHGSERTSYFGPKISEIDPVKVNEFNSPNSFNK